MDLVWAGKRRALWLEVDWALAGDGASTRYFDQVPGGGGACVSVQRVTGGAAMGICTFRP